MGGKRTGMKATELSDLEVRRDDWGRALLAELLDAAIGSANPALLLADHLPSRPTGRCVVVGAGKAAASMAAAVEKEWHDADISGCVVVPYGYGTELAKIRLFEAGHPVPDENSVLAGRAIMSAVSDLEPGDLVLALISGGGSATMCLPAAGVTLEEKIATNRLLLASGLDIRSMNAIRRRLSAIKGGKLAAAAHPARVVTLAISDIPGDEAEAIASGPTAPHSRTGDCSAAVEVLRSQLPDAVRDLLARSDIPPDTSNAEPIKLIATAGGALKAAAQVAERRGIRPIILGDAIEGEARDVARRMASEALEYEGPCVLLSGGETTVTVDGKTTGRGGRNTEFLLALVHSLGARANIWAIAADTDGEDGANLGAAGAIATPDTLQRARMIGLDPAAALENHDSGGFFEALGGLVVTGPTLTNVNDFRAILIMPNNDGEPNTENCK